MDLGKALKQLGFTPEVDFVLQNDGDTSTVGVGTSITSSPPVSSLSLIHI